MFVHNKKKGTRKIKRNREQEKGSERYRNEKDKCETWVQLEEKQNKKKSSHRQRKK